LKLIIAQKYSRVFFGRSEYWNVLPNIDSLLSVEGILRLNSSSDFELFILETKRLFEKKIEEDLEERLKELRK
jgi:hypothetical protein